MGNFWGELTYVDVITLSAEGRVGTMKVPIKGFGLLPEIFTTLVRDSAPVKFATATSLVPKLVTHAVRWRLSRCSPEMRNEPVGQWYIEVTKP